MNAPASTSESARKWMGFPGWIGFGLLTVAAALADAANLPALAATWPLAPALLPGASAILDITLPGQAKAALERAFDDPIHLQLKAGNEPADITPANCLLLLGAQAAIAGTQPAEDWNVLQQRLSDCHALRWLAGAKPAAWTALPASLEQTRATRQWPASVWPAISRAETEALSRPGTRLQSASGRKFWQRASDGKPGIPALQLESRGYRVSVQWLARADFDGDGGEDWLLRWQAQAVGGSWKAACSLLLTRKDSSAAFKVTAPELPGCPGSGQTRSPASMGAAGSVPDQHRGAWP